MLIKTRRDFLKVGLKSVAAVGGAGMMAKFAEMNALAAGAPYSALVCVFLGGGNNGFNTVVPINAGPNTFGMYSTIRQGLALPQASLLPVTMKNGYQYGLHSKLPEIQSLFNSGKAAIVEIGRAHV